MAREMLLPDKIDFVIKRLFSIRNSNRAIIRVFNEALKLAATVDSTTKPGAQFADAVYYVDNLEAEHGATTVGQYVIIWVNLIRSLSSFDKKVAPNCAKLRKMEQDCQVGIVTSSDSSWVDTLYRKLTPTSF